MAYLFGANDKFIKGASASGLIFGLWEQADPYAQFISLPAPGSGLMFGPNDINNNADHVNVGTIEVMPGIDLNPVYLKDGLWREKFDGYMNDDVDYFKNKTPIPMNRFGSSTFADTFGGFGSQQIGLEQGLDPVYSLQWTGFFLAPTTGVYTFYTISDDCSFLWLGENARLGNFNRANALVDNGGAHGSEPKIASHSVLLTAGQYYPMRMQFGEAGGGESCMVFYSNNAGQTKVTDIRNKLYYDEVNTILQ